MESENESGDHDHVTVRDARDILITIVAQNCIELLKRENDISMKLFYIFLATKTKSE